MLEEVVVTAMKRETSLMETATAVSSFDAAARDELGIDNGFDLAIHTPSFNYVPSRISIRGVGRANIALGSDPGVGIYLDGVYNTETDIFSYSNFLDIERVEVLRGPQGTLYGRNSIGGAVNFISTQPNHDEWGGKVIAEVGNYDYFVAQGLASGPITQKLSGVFALSQIQRGGLQENEGSAVRFDEEESTYGSISLQHLSTDNWTNTLKVFKRNSDVRRRQPYVLDPYNTDYIQQVDDVSDGEPANFPGIFPGNNFVNGYQGATRQNPALQDESDVSVDFRPAETQRKWAASFISEYEFEDFTLKYTGGYADFSYDEEYDADGLKAADSGLDWSNLYLTGIPVSLITGYTLTPAFTVRSFDQSNTNWSHDLQVITDLDGSVNFIGGLYYYNSQESQNFAYREFNDELMATYATFGGYIDKPVSDDGYLFRQQSELETTSYAAYGQMDWAFSYSTVLTLGLRYSYDKKDGADNSFTQWVGDVDSPTVYRNIEDSWDKVTWRVGLDHTLADNHFLYGFVATGYRSGGFNLGSGESTPVGTVDPEDLLSYEIGYKGSLADNRVNLTTALYYYDYSNIQVLKTDQINGVSVPIYENAADANAWGFEVGLDALLTQRLSLLGTYSYNSTEYEDYQSVDSNACALGPLAEGNSLAPLCTQEQDLKGNQFARTPENQVALNLVYQWQMATLDWRAVGVYSYIDDQWSTAFNNDDYDLVQAYDRWDARLSVGSQNLTWELTAYIKNITGTREEFQRDRPSTVSQLADSRLIDPRIYGLRFAYNF